MSETLRAGGLRERPVHGLPASWSQLRARALDAGLVMLLPTFFFFLKDADFILGWCPESVRISDS